MILQHTMRTAFAAATALLLAAKAVRMVCWRIMVFLLNGT